MRHKSKPYLCGIQEFEAAAYVKDLKAGKLDACTQQGRFMGYDSKCKGYRIYWPTKRSITVKLNVVFSGNDIQATESSTTFSVGVQSERERDKVIQYLENHKEHPKEVENQQNEPIDESVEKGDPKTTNTILFHLFLIQQLKLKM